MKKIALALSVIAGLILIGLINRENAKLNTEAIEALPAETTELNIPLTREELEARRQGN